MRCFLIVVVVGLFFTVYADDDVCPMDAPSASCEQPAKTPTKEKNSPAAKSDIWVCPMHADVTSNKEGSCSKCGMKLVKKERPNKKK